MADDSSVVQEMRENIIKIIGILEKNEEVKRLEILGLKEEIKVANNRIADLEDAQKWNVRLIVGGVITGVMAFIFK